MYKKITGIYSPKDETTLWRYLSFEKFVNLLSEKSLYFARADKFDDKFEGHVPPLIEEYYEKETKRFGTDGSQAVIKLWHKWRKWVMCSCWHRGKQESMGMWGRYDLHNSGIAIKTTIRGLRDSFSHKGSVDVHIGRVWYKEYQDIKVPKNIREIHTIYLPFFYKRKAFEFENEVRAIIDASPYIKERFFRMKEGFSLSRKGFDLPTLLKRLEDTDPPECKPGQPLLLDLNTLIDEVIVSPYAEKWITKTVESVVRQYGFKFPVSRSKLLDSPD